MGLKLSFQVFGLLRDYFPDGEFEIQLASPILVHEIKDLILSEYNFDNLQAVLESCAIASETELLSLDTLIHKNMVLLIFPPVSGG